MASLLIRKRRLCEDREYSDDCAGVAQVGVLNKQGAVDVYVCRSCGDWYARLGFGIVEGS